MIKTHIVGKTGFCKIKCKGNDLELLSEASIIMGHILYGVFKNKPDDEVKENLLKQTFEDVLDTMKKLGERDAK